MASLHYAAVLARRSRSGYNVTVRTFSLGVLIKGSHGTDGVHPAVLAELASGLVGTGCDALFVTSALVDGVEPLTTLASIAISTDLILGAIVSLSSGRHPAIVTKEATTLALLAPGRTVLLFEDGAAGDSSGLVEAVVVANALRNVGPITAGGDFYRVRDAFNEPRPEGDEAQAIGAVVGARVPEELSAVSDLILVRCGDGDDLEALPLPCVPLVGERHATASTDRALVVEVHGGDVGHIMEVLARFGAAKSG
jgi:hypothetical protein